MACDDLLHALEHIRGDDRLAIATVSPSGGLAGLKERCKASSGFLVWGWSRADCLDSGEGVSERSSSSDTGIARDVVLVGEVS